MPATQSSKACDGATHPVGSNPTSTATGQLLACLAGGHTGRVGGGTDVGDRRKKGVLSEVVGLPPGDLVQEIGLGSAAQRGGGQNGELELVLIPSTECALGQEPVLDSL